MERQMVFYGPVALGLLAACAAASPPASAPATQPAVPPAVMEVLKDLESAGTKYDTIRANVDYQVTNPELGDSSQQTGWVAYQRAGVGEPNSPAKFRITFETLKQGAGPATKARTDWIFDGQWLAHLDHRTTTITEYQLAAKGQRVEPLRIGKGPFPLPFGQKVKDVLEHFTASTRPASPYDPKGTVYLRLVVRPEHAKSLNVTKLDLWMDKATRLPVKMRSWDANGYEKTVVLTNTQTNRPQDAAAFAIPRKEGWQRTVQPLEQAGAAGP